MSEKREKLSVDEIAVMTEAQLGKHIAILAGLEMRKEHRKPQYRCPKLKLWFWTFTMVQSLDRIAPVERVVIEKVGHAVYGDCLETVVNPLSLQPNSKLRGNWICHLATATARQRAESCLLALQGESA
jgi:hypothetical protein